MDCEFENGFFRKLTVNAILQFGVDAKRTAASDDSREHAFWPEECV
jgi:hypothetical protein